MHEFPKEMTKEILSCLDLPKINYDNLEFNGKLVAHNLSFPIDQLAASAHGACGVLLNKIWELQGGKEQKIKVDIPHAYLSLSSLFFLRRQNYPVYTSDPSYPTVDLYETRDGRYIFINGGHPRLRDRILRVLEVPNDVKYITNAILKNWDALALEEAISNADGTAAMARTKEEWLSHPQGKILAERPLIEIKKLNNSKPEPLKKSDRPLSGLKVLDLTAILAGPSAARFFAEHGAEVLHVSAAHLPVIPPFNIDTGHGKREAYLDFRIKEDLDKFKKLLSEADVFVEGWRLGVLEKYGLSPEEVQKIRPGIIHLTLNCYGMTGLFSRRGGWEQIGQAVAGVIESNRVPVKISDLVNKGCFDEIGLERLKKKSTSSDDVIIRPSDTVQSNFIAPSDYISGFLGAAGVLSALIKRNEEGGGYHINTCLSRTNMWFMSKSPFQPEGESMLQNELPALFAQKYRSSSVGPWGNLSFLSPVVQLSETPPYFQLPSSPPGSGTPAWA